MAVQLGPGTSNGWFSFGEQLHARLEDGVWWTDCPACGWTAAADSWEELFRLTSEFHDSPESKHRAWVIYSSSISPLTTTY